MAFRVIIFSGDRRMSSPSYPCLTEGNIGMFLGSSVDHIGEQ